jgi:hypothetical protein
MRITFSTTVSATLLAAGLVAGASAPAAADPQTDGSGGIGSGNQVNVPVDVEAQICGNSLAVLGISAAQCSRVAEVLYAAGEGGSPTTDGSGGIASGNQINIPVDVAIEVCGNSAAVGGVSAAECTEIAEALAEESEAAPTTDGSGGIASGNQINIPVDVAIEVCGNAIAVLGTSAAECSTVVNVIQESPDNGAEAPATDGTGGAGSGNQVTVPVDAAVPICENALAVLGIAEPDCLAEISEEPAPEEPPADGGDPGDRDEPDGGTPAPEKPADPDPERPAEGDRAGDTPEAAAERGPGGLPLTGTALTGLIAAGVAAVGGGAAAMYAARRRRSAAAAAAAPEGGADDPADTGRG